ncbi:MAG: AAA family ATPase [Planktotalea arctica]
MSDYTLQEDDLTFVRALRDRVGDEMFGIDSVINALLIALLTRGHVLLEGNPGLGKTALIRALSKSLGIEEPLGGMARRAVGRIQFTPDLMPSDITGTKLPDDNDRLVFQHGPIFANLLLADEINRATPKTQSAMLEAMAEFQVTVLGETYPLTEPVSLSFSDEAGTMSYETETPFLVMATQNPVEQEGTNPLPEAQLDRFLFKVRMPFPTRTTLADIVRKDVTRSFGSSAGAMPTPTETQVRLHRLGSALRGSAVTAVVQKHILNLVMATVGKLDQLEGISDRRTKELREFCAAEVEYPLGPRSAVAMTLATLAWAAIAVVRPNEPEQLTACTTESFAAIVVPTLRHRTKFASSLMGFGGEGEDPQNRHDDLVRRLAELTCPDENATAFKAKLDAMRDDGSF